MTVLPMRLPLDPVACMIAACLAFALWPDAVVPLVVALVVALALVVAAAGAVILLARALLGVGRDVAAPLLDRDGPAVESLDPRP